MTKVIAQRGGPHRLGARDRQPPEPHAEDELKNQREPEDGHGDAHERQSSAQVIEPRVLTRRTEHSECERENRGEKE